MCSCSVEEAHLEALEQGLTHCIAVLHCIAALLCTRSVKEVCLEALERGAVYDPSQQAQGDKGNINYRGLYQELDVLQVGGGWAGQAVPGQAGQVRRVLAGP